MNPLLVVTAGLVVAAAWLLVLAGCAGLDSPAAVGDLLDHPAEAGPRVQAVTRWETVPGWRQEVVDIPPYPGYRAMLDDYPSFALYPEVVTSVTPIEEGRVEVRIARGTTEKNEVALLAPARLGDFLSVDQWICVEVHEERIAAISFDVTIEEIKPHGSYKRVRSRPWLEPDGPELPVLIVTPRTLSFETDWSGDHSFGSVQFRPGGISFFTELGGRGATPGFDPEPWDIIDAP